jgi:polar amino acid transport system permease protein
VQWQFQLQNAFAEPVVHGVWTTLWLTVAAMAMGVLLGIVLAVMRLSPNPVLAGTAWFYIWVFRGTPVLVQLVIWANLGSLYRQISLGIPFGPAWFTVDTRNLVRNAVAALLGLGLNEAAYMSEIIRAGILAVDEGQGRQRRPSACPGCRPCAGSCCRRRCASSSRPQATRRSRC